MDHNIKQLIDAIENFVEYLNSIRQGTQNSPQKDLNRLCRGFHTLSQRINSTIRGPIDAQDETPLLKLIKEIESASDDFRDIPPERKKLIFENASHLLHSTSGQVGYYISKYGQTPYDDMDYNEIITITKWIKNTFPNKNLLRNHLEQTSNFIRTAKDFSMQMQSFSDARDTMKKTEIDAIESLKSIKHFCPAKLEAIAA